VKVEILFKNVEIFSFKVHLSRTLKIISRVTYKINHTSMQKATQFLSKWWIYITKLGQWLLQMDSFIGSLTLERWPLVIVKSSILIPWESLVPKNPKALIGSQTTIEDLPFPHKIPRTNSYPFVLHRKILYHSSNTKYPCQHSRVKMNYFSIHEHSYII